jgi:hypothetical protein
MAAGGSVEIAATGAELGGRIEADLLVYHRADPTDSDLGDLLGKLRAETPIVVVIPAADLGQMVDLMKDPRVGSVMVAEDLDPARLSAVSTKLLFGDVFGLEKFLPWGVRIYSMLVGDYQEKSIAIAAISDFAAALGVRRKYRESIEQAIDELLMNALYDAPVDQSGRQLFAEVPTKTRISLRLEQKAVIQYACDGERFAVSVRDSFGMLGKDVIVKYLEKCLRSSQQIDRKTGGAGLGLYLVANSASEFHVNLFPGVATEAICVFDLRAPKMQLKSFGVYKERIDVAGRLALAGPPRRLAAPTHGAGAPGGLRAALAAAVLLLCGSLAVVVWREMQHTAHGTLVVTSEPTGAEVLVDHVRRGRTPLRLDRVEPGSHPVRVELAGHQSWDAPVEVAPGERATAVRATLLRQLGTMVVHTTPPGAQLLLDGVDTGKVTPATLTDLRAGEKHRITVHLNGFREATQEFTVRLSSEPVNLEVPLALAPGYGLLRVSTEPEGATVLVGGAEQSRSLDGYALKAGPYDVTARMEGYLPQTSRVQVLAGQRFELRARLLSGGVLNLHSNVDAKVSVDNHAVGHTPLAALSMAEGSHTVLLRATNPHLFYEFKLAMRKGQTIDKDLRFGRIEVHADNVVARPPGSDARGVTSVAVLPGTQHIPLLNRSTGEERIEKVTVAAGETVVIDKW